MKVVLDTNVIVAVFASRGLCADIFEVCLENHEIIISKHILSEVEENLIKKIHLPKKIVRDVIKYLKEISKAVVPEKVNQSICRDKDDINILGTALRGDAEFIITGNKDLLVLKKFKKITIVDPRAFWSHLKK